MTVIEDKLDVFMNRLNNQERKNNSAHEVGFLEGNEKKNEAEKGLAHEGPYELEEVQYLNSNRSYNFKPNNTLPTHYTPVLRNHENLSYRGGMQQGKKPVHNFQQNYAPPGFEESNQGF